VVCFSVFTLHGLDFATTFLFCAMCILLSIFRGLLQRGKVLTLHKKLQKTHDCATLLFCVCDSSNLRNFLLGLCCYLLSAFTMKKLGDLQLALRLGF
jgi:hypothetical protein